MSNVTKAICENLVIIELLRQGWHVVNLNAINNTPNADLIAIKGKRRVTIQVKGMDGNEDKSFRHHVTFARSCADYLENGIPFFNSKEGAVRADYFVGVTQARDIAATFVVMPIQKAERMARKLAKGWYDVPLLKGGRRSPNFASMVAIRPEGTNPQRPASQRNYEAVRPFINAWKLLEK